jgi:hypothetical protein
MQDATRAPRAQDRATDERRTVAGSVGTLVGVAGVPAVLSAPVILLVVVVVAVVALTARRLPRVRRRTTPDVADSHRGAPDPAAD